MSRTTWWWNGVRVWTLALSLAAFAAGSVRADEGMWTLDNLPLKILKEKYGFDPSRAWLDRVRAASVRFNDGGSGSFVSPEGLVLTNHHVARGQLQKISSPEKDYVQDGFLARTREEELRSTDLEVNVLVSMEDVTTKVMAALEPGMSDKDALEARKAVMGKIEKESLDATGLRSDVVSLYHGGEYWLYRYKKYTDIRLVFAPEAQAAFFGGDPDNFTFPRHDLDMALFRVYESERPLSTPEYLRWNPRGAEDGELVFVSGHPGSTSRLLAVAQLEAQRDHGFPLYRELTAEILGVAKDYAARGHEEARQAANIIFHIENGMKSMEGQYQGLMTPVILAKKAAEETELRALIATRPDWQEAYGAAWDVIADAQRMATERLAPLTFRQLFGYSLPNTALTIVRYVVEVQKPDGERLPEFHESQLESLRFQLFTPAPVYPGLEEALLAYSLETTLEKLGPDDPFVREALEGKPPATVAKEVISGTALGDPAFRKRLVEGGEEAVRASTDPLLTLVRRLDPMMREMRKWREDNVDSVVTSAGEKIGKARFAVYGKNAYPDATFTLRLAFGTVDGYPMNGTRAPSKTTWYGLYDRAASFDGEPPFQLPSRYVELRATLNLTTPLNFVSTCDITGGNSGSPVINRAGELVGVIFDGNIESLVGNFVYDETANRAVAVHSAAMTEALDKLYDAGHLVRELLGGAKK